MQYQVSIASLLRKLQENCWKRHNSSPVIQSIYYHDNVYSKRQTYLLYFLQNILLTKGEMTWNVSLACYS